MTGLAKVLIRVGVRDLDIKWCSDDLAATYADWPNPWSYIELLIGLGYEWSEVKAVIDTIVGDSLTLQNVLRPEFRFPVQHPAQLYNAASILCGYLPMEAVLGVFKARFPLEDIAERLVTRL